MFYFSLNINNIIIMYLSESSPCFVITNFILESPFIGARSDLQKNLFKFMKIITLWKKTKISFFQFQVTRE
jgi:hypothetical protein